MKLKLTRNACRCTYCGWAGRRSAAALGGLRAKAKEQAEAMPYTKAIGDKL